MIIFIHIQLLCQLNIITDSIYANKIWIKQITRQMKKIKFKCLSQHYEVAGIIIIKSFFFEV